MLTLMIAEKLELVKAYMDGKDVSMSKLFYKCNFNWEGLRDKWGVRLNYLTNHHVVMKDSAKEVIMNQDTNFMNKYD